MVASADTNTCSHVGAMEATRQIRGRSSRPPPASRRTSPAAARVSLASWRPGGGRGSRSDSGCELGEERLGLRPGVELALEVVGHGDALLAVVGGLPAAVRLCPLDLREAGRAHPAFRDQPLGRLAVDPRPLAARAPGREPLEEVTLVECLASPVDPPEAERALEHLGIADALDAGVLLGHLDPHPLGSGVVVLQPLLPLR